MFEIAFVFAIITLFSFLFLPIFLLIRSGHRKQLYLNGNIILRYGRWISGILLSLVFFASLIVSFTRVLMNTQGWWERENILTLVAVFLSASGILLFLFGPVIWGSLRYRIVITEKGLDIRHHFSGKRFLKWDEIEEVRYKRGSNAFTIHCYDRSILRISMMVMGLDSLLDAFEQHLPLEGLQAARVGYRRIGREFPPY